jgi:hypothetical protein
MSQHLPNIHPEKFWLGLQEDFNLEEARKRIGDRVDREVKTHTA